ncbi:hypothetical protein CFIICLFH_2133 [Methylobacterium goesingense]|nr:hypothetical protein CFIICLFH_2133 [Methylobacterium goesingense]
MRPPAKSAPILDQSGKRTPVHSSPDRPRRGRPRADQAGQIEERIITVASSLFLEQGFGRTTVDQIAELAHTGKTTLYGRFPTKEALFSAVVLRYVDVLQARMAIVPTSGSLKERLVQVGIELANLTLAEESIALMRLTIAEAKAFPELGREGFRIGFGGCVSCIAECLATDASDAALAEATPTAVRFVEMALHPLYMHAFSGADLSGLCERATRDVPEVAEILLSGRC